MLGVVEAVLAVVGGAFLGIAEHVVGGGDAGEAAAGAWVFAVAVRVVAEGEGVELSGGRVVSWAVYCVCVVVDGDGVDGVEGGLAYFLISPAVAVTGRSRTS